MYDFGTFDCTTLIREKVDGEFRMQVAATRGDHILEEEDIGEEILCLLLIQAKKILEAETDE